VVCPGKNDSEFINIKKSLDQVLQQKPLDDRFKQAVFCVITNFWPAGGEQIPRNDTLALPFLCCRSVGGDLVGGEAISSAWSLLYLALYLLDKVEDQEFVHPIFSSLDTGNLVNLTTCLIFCAERILDVVETTENIPHKATQKIRSYMNKTILTMTCGQYLDLTLAKVSLSECWDIAIKKSGEFFRCACVAGALCAKETHPLLESMEEFGYHLGLLTQIADDIEDFKNRPVVWGNTNLGVAFAHEVLPDEKSQSLSLLLENQKQDQSANGKIRSILIECGALIYLMLEAEKQKFLAEKAIKEIEMPDFLRQDFLHHIEKFDFVKPIGKSST
jgi:hypothetical protein